MNKNKFKIFALDGPWGPSSGNNNRGSGGFSGGNNDSIDDLLKRFTTQHGQLDGLDQNDHPQYVLSATNNDLSSLVTSVETSTTNLSSVLGVFD